MTKKYYSIYIIFIVSLFSSLHLYSQSGGSEGSYLSNPPRVIFPSPRESALHAAVKYNVVGNTGAPDISIPLYTISVGEINIPIVLRYSTYNTKIDGSVNPNVALGWTLEYGGSINRTLRGRPDESAIMYNIDPTNLPQFDQLWLGYDNTGFTDDRKILSRIYKPTSGEPIDSEYDLFSFNYLGSNGNFYLERNNPDDDYSSFTASFSPNFNYRIQNAQRAHDKNQLVKMEIVDGNGLTYKYGGEKSENMIEYYSIDLSNDVPTAWKLSSIVDGIGNVVSYTYTKGISNPSPFRAQYVLIDNHYNYGMEEDPGIPVNRFDVSSTPSSASYSDIIPISITFQGGRVLFSCISNVINGIEVRDENDNLIRKIVFHLSPTSHNGSMGDSLIFGSMVRLDSVEIRGSNDKTVQVYQFDYHKVSSDRHMGYDHWGYVNKLSDRPIAFVPYRQFTLWEKGLSASTATFPTPSNFTEKCYEPDAVYILHNVLKSITYPMGGRTEFTFEPNEYSMFSNSKLGNGLRIKEIIHRDIFNQQLEKIGYRYGTGVTLVSPNNSEEEINTITNYVALVGDGKVDINNISGYILPSMRISRHRTVAPSFTSYVQIGGNPLVYDKVEEVYYNGNTQSGKRINYFITSMGEVRFSPFYENSSDVHIDGVSTWHMMHIDSEAMAWRESQLYKTELLDSTGFKVQQTHYFYQEKEKEELWNMGIYKLLTYMYVGTSFECNIGGMLEDYCGLDLITRSSTNFPVSPPLVYYFYTSSKGVSYPSGEETEYFYKDGTSIKQKKAIKYTDLGGKYHYPRIVSELTSTGDTLKQSLSYPFDSYDATMQGMVSKNIVSPVVKEETSMVKTNGEAELISERALEFKHWQVGSSEFYKPLRLSERKSGTSTSLFEEEVRYDRYDDRGNLLQYTGRDGVPVSYLWGYGRQYPVLHAVGDTYENLTNRFTSEELQHIEAGGYTSDYLHNLLSKARDYYIRQQQPVHVSSYSYTPLVGLNQEVAPDGLSTHYRYDTFGRLLKVLDHNKNVVNQYQYHYANQDDVPNAEMSPDRSPVWEIVRAECERGKDFALTGYFIEEQKDINPSSASYGEVKQVKVLDLARCESRYNMDAKLEGEDDKDVCIYYSRDYDDGKTIRFVTLYEWETLPKDGSEQVFRVREEYTFPSGHTSEKRCFSYSHAGYVNVIKSWILQPGDADPTVPMWERTGNTRCSPTSIGYKEYEEVDNNYYSAGYRDGSRWILGEYSSGCDVNYWGDYEVVWDNYASIDRKPIGVTIKLSRSKDDRRAHYFVVKGWYVTGEGDGSEQTVDIYEQMVIPANQIFREVYLEYGLIGDIGITSIEPVFP